MFHAKARRRQIDLVFELYQTQSTRRHFSMELVLPSCDSTHAKARDRAEHADQSEAVFVHPFQDHPFFCDAAAQRRNDNSDADGRPRQLADLIYLVVPTDLNPICDWVAPKFTRARRNRVLFGGMSK
jgi:hypothetical protein